MNIIIEKIRAEIERRIKNNIEQGLSERADSLDSLLSVLSDLEKECSIPNDLEKYASRSGFDYVDNIVQENPGHRWNDHDVEFAHRDGIIAGAEWQREKSEKPINVLSDDLEKAAREYAMDDFYNGYSSGSIIEDTMKNFKSGAQWGAEHLKK